MISRSFGARFPDFGVHFPDVGASFREFGAGFPIVGAHFPRCRLIPRTLHRLIHRPAEDNGVDLEISEAWVRTFGVRFPGRGGAVFSHEWRPWRPSLPLRRAVFMSSSPVFMSRFPNSHAVAPAFHGTGLDLGVLFRYLRVPFLISVALLRISVYALLDDRAPDA